MLCALQTARCLTWSHVENLKPLAGSNLSTPRCRPTMPSATRSCSLTKRHDSRQTGQQVCEQPGTALQPTLQRPWLETVQQEPAANRMAAAHLEREAAPVVLLCDGHHQTHVAVDHVLACLW